MTTTHMGPDGIIFLFSVIIPQICETRPPDHKNAAEDLSPVSPSVVL